jgi:chromosome segregation ATPase
MSNDENAAAARLSAIEAAAQTKALELSRLNTQIAELRQQETEIQARIAAGQDAARRTEQLEQAAAAAGEKYAAEAARLESALASARGALKQEEAKLHEAMLETERRRAFLAEVDADMKAMGAKYAA